MIEMFVPPGDFISGKKEVIFPGRRGGIKGIVGHSGHVLALAVSSDGKFLVGDWKMKYCLSS